VTQTQGRLKRGLELLAGHLALIAPLLAALAIVTTMLALHDGTYATLGRDQGIFQYVGWSLRHGQRAYRDFHEINGPLPHAWNVLLQTVGGEDEHVFRVLDTAFVIVVYAAAAYTLPRWIGVTARTRVLLAWAAAGLAVLGAQFVSYGWWHTNQREGFYGALILASLALQATAHHTRSARRASILFALAAAVTSLTWFGKPPCVIFAVLQLGILLLDRASVVVSVKLALLMSAVGALASAALMIGFVAAYEDFSAAFRVLSAVPLLHHTIWNHSLAECYRAYDNAPRLNAAFVTTACFVAVYFSLRLPRRALFALVLPIGGFIVFAGQGKGFPYHLQMVTLGTAVVQLVILVALAQRGHARGGVTALVVAVLALGLGVKCLDDGVTSPAWRADWATLGKTKELRRSPAYLDRFEWGDFFVADLHDAAQFVQDHTSPQDRVQTYGLDPYFLFLAKRHTATPVIYNFELNIEPALEGGSGAQLTAAQRTALLAHRDAAEELILQRASASPPAAFVFFDKAPFGHPEDGELDFATHCPQLYRWVEDHYQAAQRFGTVRVRLLRL
jgi:hypothetical protein